MRTSLGFAVLLFTTSTVHAQTPFEAEREFGYKIKVDGKVTFQHVDPVQASPRDFRALELPPSVASSWTCTASIWFLDLDDSQRRTTYQEVVCKSRAGQASKTLVTKCRHDIDTASSVDMKLELKGHEVVVTGTCKTALPRHLSDESSGRDWVWKNDGSDDDDDDQ
jgi:hypothetical protein